MTPGTVKPCTVPFVVISEMIAFPMARKRAARYSLTCSSVNALFGVGTGVASIAALMALPKRSPSMAMLGLRSYDVVGAVDMRGSRKRIDGAFGDHTSFQLSGIKGNGSTRGDSYVSVDFDFRVSVSIQRDP